MSPSHTGNMPLTREELIKLKHQIEYNDYCVVESGTTRILVIRSPKEFPDIVNDLEIMINKFDMNEIENISQACVIGDAEVVGVSIDAINSLMTRRLEDDERIAEDLAEKLIEPFTTLLFESDDDPYQALRLGIRIEGNLEDFKPQKLQEILFSKIKSLPRHSEIVYLIANDGYLRLNGKEFYDQLHDFFRENPGKNKELAEEFVDVARGNLADHFVENITSTTLPESLKQEQINTFITKESNDKNQKKVTKGPDATKIEPSIENIGDLKVEKKDKNRDHESKKTKKDVKKTPKVDIGHDKDSGLDKKNKEHKSLLSIEPEAEPSHIEDWPSQSDFIIKLQGKLSETGFKILHGMEIPGVDVIGNKPENQINRIFFCYIPKFNLKKILTLERTINKYSPQNCILIGPKEDTDLKLFIVGKNVTLVEYNTIINTDFLLHLEEHL